jgi:drug/metabolite transporter (DMT)-like permease
MSIRTLAEAISHYGRNAHLLTVATDGPHTSPVTIELRGSSIGCAVGTFAAENIARDPNVSLFWPPTEPGGYALIINGAAASGRMPTSRAMAEITLTKSVLHRPGPKPDESEPRCAGDCRLLTWETGPTLQPTAVPATADDRVRSLDVHSPSKLTTSEYLRGALYGIAAVSIWASWIVAVRLGITTSLKPWDITALRFGVAGLILLPYLLMRGPAIDRLGWLGLAALVLGGGAPMVLVSYGGLLFAPAAHAASLYTALIPLYVAILAAVALGEAFTVAKRIGLVLIVTGVLGIVWGAGGAIGSLQNIGHAMFVGAGMLWACYIVALRKARLDGLHAAAIAAVGSLITYLPVYGFMFGTSLFNAAWQDLALQGFVHGLLVAVVSFMCIGRAVSILGASNGSAFAALAPAITALLAIPILSEWPATSDWIAMVLISGGVFVASRSPASCSTRSFVK